MQIVRVSIPRLKLVRFLQTVGIDPSTGVGTPDKPSTDVREILEKAWEKNEQACKDAIPEMRKRKWVREAKRVPLLGKKMGMMHTWDHWGRMLPLTVIKVDNQVVQCKKDEINSKGLIMIQLGIGDELRYKKLSKALFHHYLNLGIKPKKLVHSFMITRDAAFPVGWRVDVRLFQPGQYVDIQGTTIGKGFQGAMKKHGFSGLPATHGVSLKHRSLGSTGANQSPGRVLPGKRMHGRMGGTTKSVQNSYIYKVDAARNLLFVVGAVPGYAGNYVRIQDAVRKRWAVETPPPFPTFIPPDGEKPEDRAKELIAPIDKRGDIFIPS